eukprot:3015045-Pyramimonas_sp.AAC.1
MCIRDSARGVPTWARRAHASVATGAFCGAHHEATERMMGVPKVLRRRMRTQQFGPSVVPPVGQRNV